MVTLNVQDKNDNKPQFNDTTCQATLSEIARVSNETVVTLSAYDLDEPGVSPVLSYTVYMYTHTHTHTITTYTNF